jgi:hypothetical protein
VDDEQRPEAHGVGILNEAVQGCPRHLLDETVQVKVGLYGEFA